MPLELNKVIDFLFSPIWDLEKFVGQPARVAEYLNPWSQDPKKILKTWLEYQSTELSELTEQWR